MRTVNAGGDRRRPLVAFTGFILILAVTHLVFPSLDALFFALLLLAASPWLAQVFETVSIAGVGSITLREVEQVERRVRRAELLAPAALPPAPTPGGTSDEDPKIALAGLRAGITKLINDLEGATRAPNHVPVINNAYQALRQLAERKVIRPKEHEALADVLRILDWAIKGTKIDPNAFQRAVEIGPRLLSRLEDIVRERVPTPAASGN